MNISRFLKYLVCPYCHGALTLKSRSLLICRSCQGDFKVVGDVPVLMKQKRLNPQEKSQQDWFESHYRHSRFSVESYSLEKWRESMLERIFNSGFKNRVKTYLDVGCGATGYTVIEAAKRNNWLSFGIDISLEAMLKAKALAQKNKVSDKTGFLVCSAEHLPFRNGVFDYVSAISLLEHVENDGKVIKAVARVMREQGFFYLCVPNTYWRMWPFLWPIYKYLDYKIGHRRHYSIENLTRKTLPLFKLKKVFYNAHLMKLVQLILEKLRLISNKQWWEIERKDINNNWKGLQLNAFYQKISYGKDITV